MRPRSAPGLALALLLLAAPAWASRDDDLAAETEAYLESDAPHGYFAGVAGGGVKGWLNVRAMAWFPALHGSANDNGGGQFDLRDDVGLGDTEFAIVPQLTVDFWIFGFRTDYFDVDFQGAGSIQRTFTFGGVTFTAGEAVASEVKLSCYRSLGLIRFLNNDVVSVACILGFNYYEYKATITGATTGTATVDGVLPFPVVGLLVQVRISDVLLEVEGSGFWIEYSDIQATALDITVSAAWNFLEFGEVRVGYRYISLDGSFKDTALDLRLDGAFVSLGVNF